MISEGLAAILANAFVKGGESEVISVAQEYFKNNPPPYTFERWDTLAYRTPPGSIPGAEALDNVIWAFRGTRYATVVAAFLEESLAKEFLAFLKQRELKPL